MSLDRIDVQVLHVVHSEVSEWSDSGVPYLIAQTDNGTVKGEMFDPRVGARYRLWGEWAEDKKRGTPFFQFYSYQAVINHSREGVVDYIEQFVPGVGPKRAAALFERHGLDTIDRLRQDPAAAVEGVKGFTPEIVEEIKSYFESHFAYDPNDYASVYTLLADFHPPKKVISEICSSFKSSAVDVIKQNPYILLGYQGLGWKTVDAVALSRLNYPSRGVERFAAAVLESLKRISSEGNTFAYKLELKQVVQSLVGLGGPYDEALEKLVKSGDIEISEYNGKTIVADASLARAERSVADCVVKLVSRPPAPVPGLSHEGLEGEQVDAVDFIARNNFCILTGPPGVGKTTTAMHLIKSLHEQGSIINVVAPTGKAAKRAGEVLESWVPGSGVPATTIHKALGMRGSKEGVGVPGRFAKFGRAREGREFVHDGDEFLNLTDAFGDEWSMVDIKLFDSFLKALPPESRVVLTGDENQLPSVGPGSALRDMIAAGVPCYRLTKPRRNSGKIVEACHAIRDGRVPKPSVIGNRYEALEGVDLEAGDNWVHIEESDTEAIADTIVWLHNQTSRDPLWDLQVISPQNSRLPVACSNLNRLLSAHFNPASHSLSDREDEEQSRYSVLDKVVRTKNGTVPALSEGDDFDFENTKTYTWNNKTYDLTKAQVVNGDIGQVLDVFREKRGGKKIVVRLFNPDRLCLLPASEPYLQLAYAVTCHKFQGCGSPVVILPVHHSFYWDSRTETGLWNRELLYTMFSRAEELLITVGRFDAIRLAVGRKTVHRRKTRLAHFIKERMKAS